MRSVELVIMLLEEYERQHSEDRITRNREAELKIGAICNGIDDLLVDDLGFYGEKPTLTMDFDEEDGDLVIDIKFHLFELNRNNMTRLAFIKMCDEFSVSKVLTEDRVNLEFRIKNIWGSIDE